VRVRLQPSVPPRVPMHQKRALSFPGTLDDSCSTRTSPRQGNWTVEVTGGAPYPLASQSLDRAWVVSPVRGCGRPRRWPAIGSCVAAISGPRCPDDSNRSSFPRYPVLPSLLFIPPFTFPPHVMWPSREHDPVVDRIPMTCWCRAPSLRMPSRPPAGLDPTAELSGESCPVVGGSAPGSVLTTDRLPSYQAGHSYVRRPRVDSGYCLGGSRPTPVNGPRIHSLRASYTSHVITYIPPPPSAPCSGP